ncbi:MAG: hypothetical protein WB767_07335 [Nocardioides sp.]
MAANRRKVLIPLATLVVAGSVAVGSGATFTSTTASTTTLTSGIVSQKNDVSSLAITNIKDKDTVTGTVTVTNTGTLDADLTLAQISAPAEENTFNPGDLKLKITVPGATAGSTTVIYDGNFGAMPTTPVALGSMAPDTDGAGPIQAGSITATFVVSLNESVDNTNEGKKALASFQWVSTQKGGSSIPFIGSLPVFDN